MWVYKNHPLLGLGVFWEKDPAPGGLAGVSDEKLLEAWRVKRFYEAPPSKLIRLAKWALKAQIIHTFGTDDLWLFCRRSSFIPEREDWPASKYAHALYQLRYHTSHTVTPVAQVAAWWREQQIPDESLFAGARLLGIHLRLEVGQITGNYAEMLGKVGLAEQTYIAKRIAELQNAKAEPYSSLLRQWPNYTLLTAVLLDQIDLESVNKLHVFRRTEDGSYFFPEVAHYYMEDTMKWAMRKIGSDVFDWQVRNIPKRLKSRRT